MPAAPVAAVAVIPAARISANPSAIAAPANRTGWCLAQCPRKVTKAVGARFYQASYPRLLFAQPVGRVTRRVGRVLRAIRRTRALCLNLFAHIAGNPFRNRNIIPHGIAAGMALVVHDCPEVAFNHSAQRKSAKPVPHMTHAGWELEQDSLRVRC